MITALVHVDQRVDHIGAPNYACSHSTWVEPPNQPRNQSNHASRMACRLAVISTEQAGTEMIKQIVKLKPCAGLLVPGLECARLSASIIIERGALLHSILVMMMLLRYLLETKARRGREYGRLYEGAEGRSSRGTHGHSLLVVLDRLVELPVAG